MENKRTSLIQKVRGQIGTIIAFFGFGLLTILTFGNIAEIGSTEYWLNVKEGLTSIGIMTVSLTLIQVSVKQGLSEQALRAGLNQEETTKKYQEHKALIDKCQERMLYLPYFLRSYNARHTAIRKGEFLVNNNYTCEKMLYENGTKKQIKIYENIKTDISAKNIKWATSEIQVDKYGRIIPLSEHRKKRTLNAVVVSLISMAASTLLVRGLFLSASTDSIGQKFIKLATYLITIMAGSILPIIKEYEKGAFSVPNELAELNEIWHEFYNWTIPQSVLDEIKQMEGNNEITRTDIQE